MVESKGQHRNLLENEILAVSERVINGFNLIHSPA